MKFLMTYRADASVPPASPEKMEAIGKYSAALMQAGILLMTGGLVRPNEGTKVEYKSGKFTATDGPFAESKEVIDGFALLEAASEEEARGHAERFMKLAGDGTGEILRVFDAGTTPR